jgi:hypothetical protein
MANDANIPQMDFTAAQTAAQNLHDTLYSLFSNWNAPGWLAEMVASSMGGIVFCIAFVVLMIMQAVIAIGSWMAGAFLELLGTAKEENSEDLNNLLAETVNEMLGTNLDGGDLSSGSGQGASMDSNQAIGDAILGIFEGTFGGGGPVTPDQGAANARKFAGFGVNFATSQGFLSILAEAASIGFLKEFHELPDGLMQSLGLSRLQRLALQPLIQNAITKPYTKWCQAQYRPNVLSEGQLVKALHAGIMDQGDVTAALQQLGWPDALIDFVLTDFETKLGLSDLELLLLNGDVTQDQVVDNLTLTGMPEDQALLQLKAADLSSAKAQQASLLSWAEDAYVNGFITETQWNSILSNVMISDLEEQNLRARIGWKMETPRHQLTFADLKDALVANILPYETLDTWFTQNGYDQNSQMVASWQILQAITTAENKVLFAQYKAKVLQAAGKPVPPWISDAAKPIS